MTEQEFKQAYLAVEPSVALKERVLSACRDARKRRAARVRRIAAPAACFVLVLALAVYGLSPAPAVYNGGQAVGAVPLAVTETELFAGGASSGDGIAAYAMEDGPQSRMAVAPVGVCIPLTFDRAVSVDVSEGTFYRFDPDSGALEDLGSRCAAEPGEGLYWQCGAPEAVLTVRAGLRVRTLRLSEEGGVRTLSQ